MKFALPQIEGPQSDLGGNAGFQGYFGHVVFLVPSSDKTAEKNSCSKFRILMAVYTCKNSFS